MNPNNPPRLTIPTTSASPASTTAVQTGRPPLWTLSSQRKMCRLYLYTTLKIEEILDVVYHNQLDNAPGYVGSYPPSLWLRATRLFWTGKLISVRLLARTRPTSASARFLTSSPDGSDRLTSKTSCYAATNSPSRLYEPAPTWNGRPPDHTPLPLPHHISTTHQRRSRKRGTLIQQILRFPPVLHGHTRRTAPHGQR